MIYTSYFAQMRNFPENFIPIAICGGLPNWYTGLWYRKPAPKLGFFQEWKRTGDNDYYIEHYNSEVLASLDAQEVLEKLQSIASLGREEIKEPIWESDNFHIVLLCYEKPDDFCHRHLFADWLGAQTGITIKEWKK